MFGGMSRTASFVIAMLCIPGASAVAQDTTRVADSVAVDSSSRGSPEDPILASALAARDSGNLAGAAEILRAVLSRDPENGEATRTLAQLLYWLKDVRGATALYESGLRKFPEDFSLRLDYGRMLVETRSDGRAVEVLTPLLSVAEAAPRAATLIGTLLYWQGDLSRAARSFNQALAADANLPEARRQLDEIRSASAPWLTLAAGGLHDDQPVDRINGEVEAGMFLNPLTSIAARVRPMRLGFEPDQFACPGGGVSSADCSLNAIAADVRFASYLPAARLETRVGGGLVTRSFGDPATDWIGDASLRLRLAQGFSLEARGDRIAYFATASSLVMPVMTNSGTVKLALSHPRGWLGEAAYRIEQFQDANTLRSAYAWSLAPLVRQDQVSLSFGYSIASQDAEESRFIGIYRPYYTPENIISQSALAHLSIKPHSRTTVTLRGSYAFSAHEDSPTLLPGPGGSSISFDRREFTPWNAVVSLLTRLGPGVTLSADIETMKTAFYRATTGGVRLTYQFPRIQR